MRRARRRGSPPRTRSPGSRSTCRWPTWTGPSTTSSPSDSADAVPGARVRVRFSGRLVDGFVLERAEATEHVGPRWPGWTGRVARAGARARGRRGWPAPSPTATPARWPTCCAWPCRRGTPHAETKAAAEAGAGARAGDAAPEGQRPWGGLLDRRRRSCARSLGRGRPARCGRAARTWRPRAPTPWLTAVADDAWRPAGARWSWSPTPATSTRFAACAGRRARPGRARRCSTADLGPAERYRRWLRVRRGHVRVVVGTRAAMFAPVADLGLVVVWDDGDDLHAEPRAPYPHVREVLALRSRARGRRAARRRLRPSPPRRAAARRAGLGARASGRPTLRPRAAGPRRRRRRRAGPRRGRALRAAAGARLAHGPRRARVRARCSSRSRGAATCRRWPAPAAANPPVARHCAGPLALTSGHAIAALPLVRAPGRRLGVPGLRQHAGSAPRSSGPAGRPRSWVARSRASPCAPRAATACSTRCGTSRLSSSRRPGPSRSPRAATPRRCCSTAGRCSSARTCGPARRRCAAGSTPRRSSGRPPTAAGRRRRRRRAPTGPGAAAVGPLVGGRPRAGRPRRPCASRPPPGWPS